jgi:hypothetical protein
MKKYLNNKFLMTLTVVLIAVIGLSTNSCKKEVAGDPEIFYVRVTDPDRSDSLMIGAYMGHLIAIMGQNLGEVREIWFNDQKATLNPPYHCRGAKQRSKRGHRQDETGVRRWQ